MFIETILLITAGIAAITTALLTIAGVIEWFQHRNDLKEADRSAIAVTITERMRTGQYKTVQGIFNQQVGKMTAARKVHSGDLDDELKRIHEDSPLVIWE
jgi:hypothetical protein